MFRTSYQQQPTTSHPGIFAELCLLRPVVQFIGHILSLSCCGCSRLCWLVFSAWWGRIWTELLQQASDKKQSGEALLQSGKPYFYRAMNTGKFCGRKRTHTHHLHDMSHKHHYCTVIFSIIIAVHPKHRTKRKSSKLLHKTINDAKPKLTLFFSFFFIQLRDQ